MTDAQTSRYIAPVALAAIIGGAVWAVLQARSPAEPAPISIEQGKCSTVIDRPNLDESLALGLRFLIRHQREQGNFDYEYDWVNKSYSPHDSQVRQAGVAWSLALIYHDNPTAEVADAVDKALDFFERNSATTEDGARYVVYPGDDRGSLGTVALVALAHIDFLRGGSNTLPRQRQDHLRARLDEYIKFILSARHEGGRFHAQYRLTDGRPAVRPSPYSDGEALLALVKAARYLGRDDLREIVRQEADVGYQLNNVEARREEPDSNITKGYYQWSSMAYFELATSSWGDTEKYGDWLIELADWMIDTHRTLRRPLNTGYAYEGIVPAYHMSVLRGDREHAEKFGCTIEQALAKLTSWQVGHSLANRYITSRYRDDPDATGGVQNSIKDPRLRLDVTQHQMHAVILARRYYWTEAATN